VSKSERACPECGASFTPKRVDQRYCRSTCQQAHHNRNLCRAAKVFALVYQWRSLRSREPETSNHALSLLSWLMREWIDSDARDGRGPPPVPEIVRFERLPSPIGRARNPPQPWYATQRQRSS
jgi:hypothetical protein